MYLLGNAGNCSNYYYEMAISKATASTMMSLAMCGTAPIQFNHTQTHIPAELLASDVNFWPVMLSLQLTDVRLYILDHQARRMVMN